MMCEMCGKDEELYQTEVEGTNLNLCKDCSKHGKVIKRIHIPSGREVKREQKRQAEVATQPLSLTEEPKKVLMIREDIAARIKKAREKLGMKQEELAKKLAVKESLIHHIESGKFEPSITMARRFEGFLNVSLVENVEETQIITTRGTGDGMTIGDMVTTKERRR